MKKIITIRIPKNNINERIYTVEVIFSEFLNLNFELSSSEDIDATEIILSNGSKIIFEDHFFSKFPNELSYLNCNNIPSKICYFSNQFLNKKLPIIYGRNFLDVSENKVICGLDLLASSFFMLSRWEECVQKNRDKHDRFQAIDSLAFKFNFLERPLINEYVEFLKNTLKYLDDSIFLKERKAKTIVSCDVDEPFDCTVKTIKTLFKVCVGDVLKRKNLALMFKRIRRYFFNKFGNFSYDANYTFEWYMSVCERNNLKAAFYFIPDNTERGNGCYSLESQYVKNVLTLIDKRGHEIGVHGSYQTYKNLEKTIKQKRKLEKVLNDLGIYNTEIGNRQHYLRWDSEVTPAIISKAGFKYDTTGGYADRVGFRYGVCYDFSMFDVLRRRKLSLQQRPLVVMECSIIDKKYMGLGLSKKAFSKVQELKNKCYEYNGNFTILWHNSYFMTNEHKIFFEKILKTY